MGDQPKRPLYQKLGIKSGFTVLVKNAPDEYRSYFDHLPSPLYFQDKAQKDIDFIHLFVYNMKQLERDYIKLFNSLSKSGSLWISWPKGSSGIETDLKRDMIRNYVLNNGLVDVKVCSLNEQWSGLKFVFRLKDRG